MKNFRGSVLLAPVLLSVTIALGACGGWEGVEDENLEEAGRAPKPGERLHECRFLKPLDLDHDVLICRSDDGEAVVVRVPRGDVGASFE